VNRPRTLVLAVVLACGGSLAGLAGPAAASPVKRLHGVHQFQSPSKNIGCEISKRYVRCDIAVRSWKPPPAPKSCPVDYGQGLAVGAHGKGYLVCAGDTALNGKDKKLGYGHTIRVGPMACRSDLTGMACRDHRTGHGFFVSKQSYRRF
jgi:hypothetical protein